MSVATTAPPVKKHNEFAYTVRTTDGALKRGKLPYGSRAGLVRRLLADPENEAVLDIRGTETKKVGAKARPKSKALVAAFRQISLAISVEWDDRDAFKLAAEDGEEGDYVLNYGLLEVARARDEGQRMSEAMAEHPYIFPPLAVSTIRAGEKSGVVKEAFKQAADDLEAEDALRSRVRKAMSYPMVVLGLSTLIFIGLMMFVVPQFGELYKSLSGGKAQLPALTQAVMAVSDSMKFTVPAAVALSVLGVMWYRRNSREPAVRAFVDPMKLKVPAIGQLFRKIALVRFCRILASLQRNDIHIIDALNITAASVGNAVLEKAILGSASALVDGDDWLDPLRGEPAFPRPLIRFMQFGEASGKLPEALEAAGRGYDREVDEMTANMESLIQPFFMIALAAMVAVVGVAIYLPYFSLGDVVSPY